MVRWPHRAMRILIDTHVVIWTFLVRKRISAKVRDLMQSTDSQIFVSAASAWEIAIKLRLGKLEFDEELLREFDNRISQIGWKSVPITSAHGVAAAALPRGHSDPFDRLLAAQTQIERLTLVSIDKQYLRLGVEPIW